MEMTNKLKELYNKISDEDLRLAINEIKESEKTGIIGDIVRDYARISGEITGGFTTTDFLMTQASLLKEAGYRWVNSNKTKSIDINSLLNYLKNE